MRKKYGLISVLLIALLAVSCGMPGAQKGPGASATTSSPTTVGPSNGTAAVDTTPPEQPAHTRTPADPAADTDTDLADTPPEETAPDVEPAAANPAGLEFKWTRLPLPTINNVEITPQQVKKFFMSGDQNHIYLATTRGLLYGPAASMAFVLLPALTGPSAKDGSIDTRVPGYKIKATNSGLVLVSGNNKVLLILVGEKVLWGIDFTQSDKLFGKEYTINSFNVVDYVGAEYVVFPSNRLSDDNFAHKTNDVASEKIKIKDKDLPKGNKHHPSKLAIDPNREAPDLFPSAVSRLLSYGTVDKAWVFVTGNGLFLREKK